MRVFSKSDIGLKRKSNQDYCKTGIFSDGAIWAVVCDGVGGENGGDIASRSAVESVEEFFSKSYIHNMSGEEIMKFIDEAVQYANRVVFDIAANVKFLHGMGTTIVCAVVKDGVLHIVHAGDSRAYLYENDELIQLTTDHSFVQEMVSAGEITPEEAKNHPRKNFLTRALGIEPKLKTDYTSAKFNENSVLLICTDGLSNYIDDTVMKYYIRNYDGEELAQKLVESAKTLGGGDNITVAVISGKLS